MDQPALLSFDRPHVGMTEEARLKRLDRIGGSDARIIMSGDQPAIEHLWRVKRREIEDEDLSDVLVVQLGNHTEALNTAWFERRTGLIVTDEQRVVLDPAWPVASTTLDGLVRVSRETDPCAVFEAKFMLPFGWSIEEAQAKYMPQLQHNMTVTGHDRAWLSVITGGGQWKAVEVERDEFYCMALRDAEEDFWDCVKTGRTPGSPVVDAPDIVRDKIVDMQGDNRWAALAAIITETQVTYEKHDMARDLIKAMLPSDAVAAEGYGIKVSVAKNNRTLISVQGSKKAKVEAKAELSELAA